MAGRIRVPAAKRLQILEEFDRSGMSGLAFAELLGVIRESQSTGATTRQVGGQEPVPIGEGTIVGSPVLRVDGSPIPSLVTMEPPQEQVW